MKELGYGKGYKNAHDDPAGYVAQQYLPDTLVGRVFYDPGSFGYERKIAERLKWWAERRPTV